MEASFEMKHVSKAQCNLPRVVHLFTHSLCCEGRARAGVTIDRFLRPLRQHACRGEGSLKEGQLMGGKFGRVCRWLQRITEENGEIQMFFLRSIVVVMVID